VEHIKQSSGFLHQERTNNLEVRFLILFLAGGTFISTSVVISHCRSAVCALSVDSYVRNEDKMLFCCCVRYMGKIRNKMLGG